MSRRSNLAILAGSRSGNMGTSSQDARLSYLDEASKALTFASPVISSFMNASRKTLTTAGAGADGRTNDMCSGCAQYLFPGLTGDIVKSTKTKRTRQDRLRSNTGSEQRIRCLRCGTENAVKRVKANRLEKTIHPAAVRKTIREMPTQQRQPVQQTLPANASTPAATTISQATTPQATTPARRKTRGKNASLQALLANKKPDAPKKGYGDLMDFMKI